MRDAHRAANNPNPQVAEKYEGTTKLVGTRPEWTGRINLWPNVLDAPMNWGEPHRIFVNSMSDLFHPDVPDEYIQRVFSVIARAPRHVYQILTKRPQRALLWYREHEHFLEDWSDEKTGPWPWSCVHMGVSAEDPETWQERVLLLPPMPVKVRWVACEPLLDLIPMPMIDSSMGYLDWVVVGGESGPYDRVRPCHPDWVRRFRDVCRSREVPFAFKQWGNWLPLSYDYNGRTEGDRVYVDGRLRRVMRDEAAEVMYAYVPKSVAGRQIDGQIHEEQPEVASDG